MDKKENKMKDSEEYFKNAAYHWIIRNLRSNRISPHMIVEECFEKNTDLEKNHLLKHILDILTGKNKEKYDLLLTRCNVNNWEFPKVPERFLKIKDY